MKFVLRNKHTGRYLQRVGLWVARLDDALTFEDMVDVREYCQAHDLKNVQPIRRLMPYLVSLLHRGRSSASVGL